MAAEGGVVVMVGGWRTSKASVNKPSGEKRGEERLKVDFFPLCRRLLTFNCALRLGDRCEGSSLRCAARPLVQRDSRQVN